MNEDYGNYCRPRLYELLQSLDLDVAYHRGEGDRLWYWRNGLETEVLDLTGGYGANIFGHNHPALVAVLQDLYAQKVPVQVQGSCRPGAGALAKKLCERLGDGIVIFTNSGTETIEAALKHAFLQRGRPKFWAVRGAFHGKTLGAVQLNWNYRLPFTGLGPEVDFIDPFGDPAGWLPFEQEAAEVNALFFEPILGEGGIRPLPEAFIDWIKNVSAKHGILLIADEIQSGMGRTGYFLACDGMGIEPDYVCLSKSLGGGLAKIGALHIQRRHVVEEFPVIHTSTFAEDEIGCRIAEKALQLLENEHLITACADKGRYFLEKLEAVQQDFPQQIREVRGKGLMLGIEFEPLHDSPSNLLKMVSDQGYFGYLAAAWFLNVHQIRIAPTMSQPGTLRIEPSAFLQPADMDRFADCLRQFCAAVGRLDMPYLTGFLAGVSAGRPPSDNRQLCRPVRQKPQTDRKVAFIGNFLLPEHISLFDPALSGLHPDELDRLITKTAPAFQPHIFDRRHVRSLTGEMLHLSFVGLNFTAETMMRAWAENRTGPMLEKINMATKLVQNEGCNVLGLGSQTSIITANGLRVRCPDGLALTSGNSLTVGMGILALKKAAALKNIRLAETRLAIIGALGNIASIYAEMMAPEVAELVLIVRDTQSPRLHKWITDLRQIAPALRISPVQDMCALRDCALIVAASNAPEPLIFARHLPDGPVVICDISAPTDVDASVRLERPNTTVIPGGLVRLPSDPDFSICGIPLEPGYSFACMAETMLLGLEDMTGHFSYGKITAGQVRTMLQLAAKHGFVLGSMEPENLR